MNESKTRWDEDILYDLCNERDMLLIIQILIPIRQRIDTWYWLFENDGEFSVKSCYRQLRGEVEDVDRAFWSKL